MDNSLTTTITTASAAVQTPWPSNAQAYSVAARLLRLINPLGSGAFDFSINAGATWHTRTMSAGLYSEDFDVAFLPNDVRVRRNGSTDLSGLVVEALF